MSAPATDLKGKRAFYAGFLRVVTVSLGLVLAIAAFVIWLISRGHHLPVA